MKLIDANVILRYLLNDNDSMAREAKEIIGEGAYTLCAVIAEVVYVLTGVYRVPRSEVFTYLSCLLGEIEVEDKPVILFALRQYAVTNLDFVDCLLLAYNQILQVDVATFDKKLGSFLSNEAD